MAYDKVMSLYEALTRQGRGGLLAHMIMTYPKSQELKEWVVMAPADSLGPLLYILSSAPKAFDIPTAFNGSIKKYNTQECHLVQQLAISRLITWVAEDENEHAEQQFIESCIRMNKFADRSEDFGQAYCENRMSLDMFMKEPVMRFSRSDGTMARKDYLKNSILLGYRMDSKCRITYFNRNLDNPAGSSKYVG